MQWDYFISYASEDRARAEELVSALETTGARCFIDRRDIAAGDVWRERLMIGIKESEAILVLLSDSAQASDEVLNEVNVAVEHGRRRTPIWLEGEPSYWNNSLELLLSSSQWIRWDENPLSEVVAAITAVVTVSQLRGQLAGYESVTEALKLDLEPMLDAIDEGEFHEAIRLVEVETRKVLQGLWRHYESAEPAPNEFEDLARGCRDLANHESTLSGLAAILRIRQKARLKKSTLDMAMTAVDGLMAILSSLRAQRLGLRRLSTEVDGQARFLTGLMTEAGWLQGAELVPNADVVYMLFERSAGSSTKYLEILLGADPATVQAIAQESEGQIMTSDLGDLKTRFLILPPRLAGESTTLPDGFLTPDEFVIRFTGVKPRDEVSTLEPQFAANPSLESAVVAAMRSGDRNMLVYGRPGTGKSATLRRLANQGWEDAPPIVFYVDYSLSDESEVDSALDDQLSTRFPVPVRHRTRELVSYLVRSGHAALVLDSIECAANPSNSTLVAHTLARLCSFLSRNSTVILAGRDAALRDSPAVREFFLDEPAISDQLSHMMRSAGVDAGDLPRFRLVRARPTRMAMTSSAARSERISQVLSNGIWQGEDNLAADSLAEFLAVDSVRGLLARTEALREMEVRSLALGHTPSGLPARHLSAPGLSPDEPTSNRSWRELRAAVDYVKAVVEGRGLERWHDVSVGETARRLIRLLGVLVEAEGGKVAEPRLALVGPASSVIAIRHGGVPRLESRTVTAGEYRSFLRSLSDLDASTLVPGLPDVGKVLPMYERVPVELYRDESHFEYPAVGVSWWGASAYAAWRGQRLPTSLEWEISGRGWDGRVFPWGDEVRSQWTNSAETVAGSPLVDYQSWRVAIRSNQIAACNGRPSQTDSGNVSSGGQLDMVGNVWEWTSTEIGDLRVVAGGSYDNPLRACLLSTRSAAKPATRSNAVGFRLVDA